MKWVPISLALAVHSIGFFGAIKAQAPQPKSIKQLFKERDLDALAWRFQQNTPNIDEASIGNQTPLVAACSKLDVGMVGFLLNKIQNANPNLFNPLGVTLRAIIDLHKHTEPDKTPPTTIEIPEFPQAKAIEEILDTLIKSGANPLTHKLENIQLLNELTKAFQSTSYIATKNPIIISMRKLLPMFLTYEVGYPFDPSTPKGKRVYGDIRLVTTYLESINNLYNKYPNTDGFDPLNTPLINNGEGFLGKTPVQLAAENGHTDRLTAMLALKDNLGHTRVSFVTAYNASKAKVRTVDNW